MAKPGQAKVLTATELDNWRKNLLQSSHRLFFDVLRYTGERIGAVCQLKISDCYLPSLAPKASLTFRAATRKASPNGKRKTREVPLHPALRERLLAYHPPTYSGYLFPSKYNSEVPVCSHVAIAFLNRGIERAKLTGRGISSHSFRRTAITKMSEAGIDVRTIQLVIGHESLETTQRYIEANPTRIKAAITVL